MMFLFLLSFLGIVKETIGGSIDEGEEVVLMEDDGDLVFSNPPSFPFG